MKRSDRPSPDASGSPAGDDRTDAHTADRRRVRASANGSAGTPPSPSWSRVIGATIRVWFNRRSKSRTVRSVAAAVVALAVVATGATLITASRDTAPSAPSDTAAADPSAGIREKAAAWVVQEIDHRTRMACDPSMCKRLTTGGIAGGKLLKLTGDTTELSGVKLVISSAAVRARFGVKLAYTIAPDVLGIFGTGENRVEVRVRADDGPAAYRKLKTRETKYRGRAGRQLLDHKHVHTTSQAMHELAAGEVDSRVVYTVANLARHHVIHIRGFGDRGPHTGTDVPLRSVAIDQIDGSAAINDNPAMKAIRYWLRTQHKAYRPARTKLAPAHDSGSVLRIAFAAPSPHGLLSHGLPQVGTAAKHKKKSKKGQRHTTRRHHRARSNAPARQ